MGDPELTITICRLDCAEVGAALNAAAVKLERKAEMKKPGIVRDNMLARAIRLKRTAKTLTDGE